MKTGHQIIEEALAKAALRHYSNAPAGYDPAEAKAHQEGMADAYRHALEMIPEEKATPWRVEEMGPHFRKLHLSVGSAAVQLHHFTGPDLYEPHDHPYAFTSYIVAGGYVEEVWTRGEGSEWVKQVVQRLPGTMHRVEADTVHKIVHLLADDCITAVTWLPEGKKRREPRFWKPWLTPTLCRLHNEPDNWVVA